MVASVQTLRQTDNKRLISLHGDNAYTSIKSPLRIRQEQSDVCRSIQNSSDMLSRIALSKLSGLYPELMPSTSSTSYCRAVVVARRNAIQSLLLVTLRHITFNILFGNEAAFREKSTFWISLKKHKDYKVYSQAFVCLKAAIDETMDSDIRERVNLFIDIVLESMP